jgi:hypothetical protein
MEHFVVKFIILANFSTNFFFKLNFFAIFANGFPRWTFWKVYHPGEKPEE